MATFADDEDLDFEELWGSGGGGVDVNGTLVTVEGRHSETTTEFGDEVWPGAAALAQALTPNGVFGGAVRGKRVLELGAGGGLPGLVCAASVRLRWSSATCPRPCLDYDGVSVKITSPTSS